MQQVEDALIFSCLSGYNLYVPTRDGVADAVHFFSKDPVNIRYSRHIYAADILEKWKRFVEHPVDIQRFLWPTDIVDCDSRGLYGLVFPKRSFPKMEKLKKLLYSPDTLGLQNPLVRKLIRQLLLAFSELHAGGYVYHAFDLETMYYEETTGTVLLDFSPAMSLRGCGTPQLLGTAAEEIGIEFLPPWRKRSADEEFWPEDDEYSIATLLFRLLTGRMPYQGRFMDGYGDMMVAQRDVDPDMHIQMFQHYHENPVFIFDSEDRRNSIGTVSAEERVIDRWEALPLTIRRMFETVYSKENLARTPEENRARSGKRKLFSADQWLHALDGENLMDGD